jgi:hypothetical protein
MKLWPSDRLGFKCFQQSCLNIHFHTMTLVENAAMVVVVVVVLL